MATQASAGHASETAILSRLMRPADDNLSTEAAEAFLAIRFEQSDLDRMHELATKNQDDLLTAVEQTELDIYRRVSFLVDLMHSKARRSLKKNRSAHR